jgi:hypothetical protein
MSVVHLDPTSANDTWNRPPSAGLAAELACARVRRGEIIGRLRALQGKRPYGGQKGTIKRASEIAGLFGEYQALTLRILADELL